MPDQLPPTEALIHDALRRADYETALVTALAAYRSELFAFVRARLPSEADVEEVLAEVVEDLWSTLPRLELHSSMRSYLFQMARHGTFRHLRGEVRQQRRAVPLDALTTGAARGADPRTDTPNHLKTTNKLGVALLREQLSERDRALLQLRVDRGLSFREIAQALADEGQTLTEAQVHQEAARLRKRYQLTKDRLRVLALEAGLLRSR